MRQLHSRWSLFAGAVAASVAALSFPALAATTDTEVLAAPAIHQSPTAVYLIDGYEVTYLPSELANYSSRWESSRKNEERSSSVTWVNKDTVYGSVHVRRPAKPLTLAEVRDTYYSELTALRWTTVNGQPAYLSAADGTVFWVDGQDVILSVFLHPARWSTDELLRVARGIRPREDAESNLSVRHEARESVADFVPGSAAERSWLMASASTAEPDAAQESEEGQPRLLPAPADAPLYPSSFANSPEVEFLTCLSEEAGKSSEEFPTEGKVSGPWGSASWNSGLWALVPTPANQAAVAQCAGLAEDSSDSGQQREFDSAPASPSPAASENSVDRASVDAGQSAKEGLPIVSSLLPLVLSS